MKTPFDDKFKDKFTFGASWQVQRKILGQVNWQVLKWQDFWQSKILSTKKSDKFQISDFRFEN